MSKKLFNVLFRGNRIISKHFHLCPSYRSYDKSLSFSKSGDNGKSKIYNGELDKNHIIFEAIGVTEELSTCIGLAREFVLDDAKLIPLAEKLRKIQLVLIDAVDIISSLQPDEDYVKMQVFPNTPTAAKITHNDIADLELLISHYATLLPQVEKVIVPGGGKASAALHMSRSACRRCERVLVSIFKNMENKKNILTYINRLSTYLFQAARIAAKFANRPESIYKPHVQGEPNTAN